ncbi:Isochorismatase hydrolase [Mollisia scopiformis]|uniref:Isochorismatase hydrolase n=1 Tax=Mollisia scopiformis TaxID=149040 RepID=A0A194XAE4_MOLSC|nr:Isochorismatase hydrolase [Mollisia scopiformis]KUJ17109.1 Isochorismatase hydrolase [Mollisia scopiformis]
MASATKTGLEVKVIGNASNFWLWSERDGFDLTHPETSSSPLLHPRISLQTTNSPITIAPSKTALVIVDMQNFFLSRSLGRKGQGHDAEAALLQHALPAARKAGIQVIWLTWGLTDADLEVMSPTMLRIFKFDDNGSAQVQATGALSGVEQTTMRMAEDGAVRRRTEGIGFDIGPVKLANGQVVEGGRMLVRDTWNAAMPLDLNDSFKEGQASESNPDILIHKNRMSGFWDREMKRVKVLEEKGVRTLLFVGIKTDMCVMASLLDAWHAGFDVILLKDACGTTSPRYVSDAVEFNCARIWGFVSDSKALEQGVNNMLDAV